MNDELIRCPSCRGRKQVEKLGGVLGDCNTCVGSGKIKQVDKYVPVVSEVDVVNDDVIRAVARMVPNQVDPLESVVYEEIKAVEVDVVESANIPKKRAVYKRKSEG